jgi:hypothetical protein
LDIKRGSKAIYPFDHLKLRFVAAKPPPSQVFEQVSLTAAEESGGV